MQKNISIRFYEELNDFLEPEKRKQEFEVAFADNPSIRDLIESLGVPFAAVDLILVNGRSVPFSYKAQNRDQVSVYPVFETFDISQVTRLGGRPLRNLKFIADTNLAELAAYLQNFGLDTLHRVNVTAHEIIRIADSEGRTILTRNPQVSAAKGVVRCYLVKQTDPEQQFIEIIDHFHLK